MNNWFQSVQKSYWLRRELTGVVLKWSMITSIISTFVAFNVMSTHYQEFGNQCLPAVPAGAFGVVVAVFSTLVPPVVVILPGIPWRKKVLISGLFVVIFAMFWFSVLWTPGGCNGSVVIA